MATVLVLGSRSAFEEKAKEIYSRGKCIVADAARSANVGEKFDYFQTQELLARRRLVEH